MNLEDIRFILDQPDWEFPENIRILNDEDYVPEDDDDSDATIDYDDAGGGDAFMFDYNDDGSVFLVGSNGDRSLVDSYY
jgi:hypothetical protein